MSIFTTIKEKIFKKINNLRYTNEEIMDIIMSGLNDILDENKVDIEVEFIDHFNEEEMEIVGKAEPGIWDNSTELIGIVHITDEGKNIMIFALDAIRNNCFPYKIFKSDVNVLIRTIAWHESYHVYQYMWLFKNNGIEAVDEMISDITNQHYEDNILEKGAYDFQYFGRVEDMKEVFKKYLDKDKPVIDYLDIMKKNVFEKGRKIDEEMLAIGE